MDPKQLEQILDRLWETVILGGIIIGLLVSAWLDLRDQMYRQKQSLESIEEKLDAMGE